MTVSYLEQPPEWDRADWIEWRKGGIGGSDVAAVVGLSTFGGPTSVYYDKVSLAPEKVESEAMRWGRLLEPAIGEEFSARTGLHVVVPQILAWDVEHPWRRVTLDGLVVESEAVWEDTAVPASECILGTIEKKVAWESSWDDDHGGIPDRVALQCQWQMGITEVRNCWLAVLHQGRRLEIYELEFDVLVFERLCIIADRFWIEHVLAENPPATDSNPATTATLKAVYGDRADGSTLELSDELVATSVEWLAAKAAVQSAEQWRDRLENTLRADLGEHTFGAALIGESVEPLVSWKPQRKARRVDEKRLRAERPEVWDDYASPEGVTRVLRATKALKALAGATDEGDEA